MDQQQYSNDKLKIVLIEEDLTTEKSMKNPTEMEKEIVTNNECLVKEKTMNIIKDIPINTADIKRDHSTNEKAMQHKIEDIPVNAAGIKKDISPNEKIIKNQHTIEDIPTSAAGSIERDISPKKKAMQNQIEGTATIKKDISPNETAMQNKIEEILMNDPLANGIATKNQFIIDIPAAEIKGDTSNKGNIKYETAIKQLQIKTEDIKKNIFNNESLKNEITMKNQSLNKEISTGSLDIKKNAECPLATMHKNSSQAKTEQSLNDTIKNQILAEYPSGIQKDILNKEISTSTIKDQILTKYQSDIKKNTLIKERAVKNQDLEEFPSGMQKDILIKESDQILTTNVKEVTEEIPTTFKKTCETLLKDKMLKNENLLSKNWDQENDNNIVKIFPMPSIIGFITMSFDHYTPYEFTLTTMTQYTYGKCDPDGYWLYNLDSYLQKLNITVLYVAGPNQKQLIEGYIHTSTIKCMIPEFEFPQKQICPKCGRRGCSKFKAQNILRCNFYYNNFRIPCTPY